MERLTQFLNQVSTGILYIIAIPAFTLICAGLIFWLGAAAIPTIVVLAILLLFMLAVFSGSTAIVSQSNAWVVERLGQFDTVWYAGLHYIVPGIMTVRAKVSLKEKFIDIPPVEAITKDHITIEIDTIGFYQITDPERYAYGVDKPEESIEQLALSNLRNVIGGMTEEECLTGQNDINETIRKKLDEAADPWGIKFTRLEVQSISQPKAIREAIQESEAIKQKADGDAEAIRKTQKAIADSLTYFKGGPDAQTIKSLQDQLVKMKALDAIGKVADGKATKIIIPSELQGLAGFAAGMQTILDNGGTGSLLGGGTENHSVSASKASETQPDSVPPAESETRLDGIPLDENKAPNENKENTPQEGGSTADEPKDSEKAGEDKQSAA